MAFDETSAQGLGQEPLQTLIAQPATTLQDAETKQNSGVSPTATYSEKTDRIRTWSDFIKSVSRFIWIGVVLIIVAQIWGGSTVDHLKHKQLSKDGGVVVIISPAKGGQISADVAAALGKALASARSSATQNLEQWQTEVMKRVDHPFLDWYYNYFTQLGIGMDAILINLTTSSGEAKAEKLIEGFQREFAKQVFQPSLMQLQMDRFSREAINAYVAEANRGLAEVQSRYEIPQPIWDNFLNGFGNTTYNTGGKEQNLPLRALSRGTGYVATTAMTKAVGAIGTKKVVTAAAEKTVAKAATKIATKTAGKALAEGGEMTLGLVGLQVLNPIVGLGILAWDIWDHYHTVKVERPILRQNLERYLSEVKDSLLNDRENGLLSSINKFHDGIIDDLNQKAQPVH